jgi:hypothetical protein
MAQAPEETCCAADGRGDGACGDTSITVGEQFVERTWVDQHHQGGWSQRICD